MNKRDFIFIAVLLGIGYWAMPHVKEDLVRAVVPDRIERWFPRLVDRLIRDDCKPDVQEPSERTMQQTAIDQLANQDEQRTVATNESVDHGYGW